MFVTHLECAACGERADAARPATVCPVCKRPFWTRYDLNAVRAALGRSDWSRRPAGMWRYRELLPLPDGAAPVSLGEVETPLLRLPRTGARLGVENLWVKDEGRLPGESFKARGMALAVSMLAHFGVKRAALPSAGNAAGAASAYCARAGIELVAYMPCDTPETNILECRHHGADVRLVDGLISDCGKAVAKLVAEEGRFNLATLNHPYRIEGKKTMGLELADQFGAAVGRSGPSLPDVILYPTGGGTGLIGMWKAFAELRELGAPWAAATAGGGAGPRMIAVQAEGCAPIARAFAAGERHADLFPNAHTAASGLRVPATIGDFMILDAVRASGGAALAAGESEMLVEMRSVAAEEGVCLCPEAAIALAGLARLKEAGGLKRGEHALLFNTASGLKYQEALASACRAKDDVRRVESGAAGK
ncbi:MAG TPA: threonine synthase [Planctomycetia bacterium]|nr:threonine synthase [Planctomycetia bacterium]